MPVKKGAIKLSEKDMMELIQSARELSAEVTLDELLKRILEKASKLTNSPDTSVILRHEDREGLYVAAATGEKANFILAKFGKASVDAIPIKGSKAGIVYETRKSIVENKITGHFKGVDKETHKITNSMVCAPLCIGDESIGVMQILNKASGNYNDYDRLLLEHFASQAAVAIKNAQLFESMLAHSGLYSRVTDGGKLSDLMKELNKPAHAETLTVLFADMRGFTQLCQSVRSPNEVQTLLNEFISMLSDEILINDGVVNKFLGDGVMALFRANDHEIRAVKASFQIVERFNELKKKWNDSRNEQLDFLDIGIGIVTDEVTLGAVGSKRVRDFTAIGSAVNLAAALEHEARDGNRIVTSHTTYRAVRDQISAVQLDDYVLKKPGQALGVRHKRYSLNKFERSAEQQVFICHSHADRTFVENDLVKPLKDLGIKTWYCVDDIRAGNLWVSAIRHALSQSTWIAVVVSKNAVSSDWMRIEVDTALALGQMRDRIIPISIDDTPYKMVNEFLATMQGIDAVATPLVAKKIAALIDARQAA
jgi:adenylate cyclase